MNLKKNQIKDKKMKTLTTKLIILIVFCMPFLLSAKEQFVAIKVDIYTSEYDKSQGLINALNNATISSKPRFISTQDNSSRIEIAKEKGEMLSIEITSISATNLYDVKLKLSNRNASSEWQETTTSSLENKHDTPIMMTAELGSKLYISNINTRVFESLERAQAWIEM